MVDHVSMPGPGRRRGSCRRLTVTVVAIAAATLCFPNIAAASQSRPVNNQVKAAAGSEAADGVTEDKMDIGFLASLEAYVVKRLAVNTQPALDAGGVNARAPRPSASSVYMFSGGHKIAVTRMTSETGAGAAYKVHIMAIFGDEMRRVICSSRGVPITITFGPCADKIAATFGFRLG